MPESEDSEPQVISVFAGKGGIGKTSRAFDLAYQLGRVGSTLLVNADLRQEDGSSTDLYNRLKVPATFDIVEEEDPRRLSRVRQARRRRFVVIDNAPERDPEKLRASIEVADLVVVPLSLEWLEGRAIMNSVRTYVRPSGRKYRLLLTSVPAQNLKVAERLRNSLETGGHDVFSTVVRRYTAHQDAQSTGIPVTEGDWVNWTKAGADVYGFVDEVLEALGQTERVERRVAVEKK